MSIYLVRHKYIIYDDENQVFFEYETRKFTDTGFSLSHEAIIDEEIDQLVHFCLKHMKNQ